MKSASNSSNRRQFRSLCLLACLLLITPHWSNSKEVRKMKKRYVVVMIIAGILLSAGFVLVNVHAHEAMAGRGDGFCAGMGPGDGLGFGMGEGYHGKRLAAELNLSKEQQAKMTDLRKKFRDETKDLRNELLQKRAEMGKLYSDPKTDEGAIVAKQKEMDMVRQKLHDRMIQMKLEVRRMLTPEQLKKIGELQADRAEHEKKRCLR
jgi:Spy/CpxP family protein refolding chaperone